MRKEGQRRILRISFRAEDVSWYERIILCFGGRGLLEYIYILRIRAGDIILTLLLSLDSDRARDIHMAFIPPRTLCHPNGSR